MEERPMTIRCSDLDNLLFDGDPASLALAAEHARTCDPCMPTLTTWNELGETARSMQTTWNSDLLWPRIERGLRKQTRSRWVTLLQIAAVLLLISGMAIVAWRFRQRSKFDEFILQTSAVAEVERAQEAHLAAIEKLERVAGPKLDASPSPLLVNYKEKLMLLDDAIAECQSNIDHNRQNAQLRRQLLAIYGEKQQTLQNVLREEIHATP
jgi:flagellar basal body-associated protein FliL